MGGQHIHIFLIQQMRHAVRRGAVVEQSALFGGFLNPGIVIAVAVENDTLVVPDGLTDHFMQCSFEIRRVLKAVRINLQALGNRAVEHHIGAGDAVGGAKHTELEFIAGEGER